MNSRTRIVRCFIYIASIFTTQIFCGEPTLESMSSVYNTMVKKGNSIINPIPAPNYSPGAAFSQQPFILWDYAEDINSQDTASAVTHWTNLVNFIKSNNITRVITFIKDPISNPFFSTSNSAPNTSFQYWASQLPSSCQLEVQFDNSPFCCANPPVPPAVCGVNCGDPCSLGTPNPSEPYSGSLPDNFCNLPQKMLWAQTMIEKGVPIKGITLDPETIHLPLGDEQILINYMDYYRYVNRNSMGNIRLAVTFGIDERNPTFSNLSTFPLPSQYVLLDIMPENFPSTGGAAPPWRPGTTYALLNSVYIQVYQPDIPYIFTFPTNPTYAATSLLHNFRDEPYLPSTVIGSGNGTISYNMGSANISGTNTQFATGQTINGVSNIYQVIDGMPFGVQLSLPDPTITQIGIVDGDDYPITNTSFTFYSTVTHSSQNNVPFFQTEIVNKWTFPYATSSLVNNIYLMFSFENTTSGNKKFFGSWTIDQFMSFLQSFYSQGQTSFPIYNSDASTSIPLPNNFGIYDFNIFCEAYGIPN